MRVLVTRPQEDGEATARTLRAAGHDVLLASLLETRFLEGAPLDLAGVAAILVTSANGARALALRTARRDLPLFAVGPQSAATAREAGFVRVECADGDAEALAQAVPRWIASAAGTLLHVSGRESAGALAERLAASGYDVRREILYAAEALPLPPAICEALKDGGVDAVLLFSPRSATLFRDDLMRAKLDAGRLEAFCISAATAAALAPLVFARVHVAPRPNQDALLALLAHR